MSIPKCKECNYYERYPIKGWWSPNCKCYNSCGFPNIKDILFNKGIKGAGDILSKDIKNSPKWCPKR